MRNMLKTAQPKIKARTVVEIGTAAAILLVAFATSGNAGNQGCNLTEETYDLINGKPLAEIQAIFGCKGRPGMTMSFAGSKTTQRIFSNGLVSITVTFGDNVFSNAIAMGLGE